MTHDEMIGLFCPKVSATSIMAIEAFTKPQQGFTSGHQTSSMLMWGNLVTVNRFADTVGHGDH